MMDGSMNIKFMKYFAYLNWYVAGRENDIYFFYNK